jgi:hypothetical protein
MREVDVVSLSDVVVMTVGILPLLQLYHAEHVGHENLSRLTGDMRK